MFMSNFLYVLYFQTKGKCIFFAIMALRRRIIYKVQKGRNALSTFQRALLFCCKSLWLALGQWFQSYNFPLPRLRFSRMVFSSCCFVMSLFLQWLPTSFPSLFPSELSSSYDAFNRPPPVYILLPPNLPRSLEHSMTRIIHSAIYLSVYNPMASSSCPYLANLDNLAIPVASLVMLISFTCSYLPILIITRRACHLCDVQCAQ